MNLINPFINKSAAAEYSNGTTQLTFRQSDAKQFKDFALEFDDGIIYFGDNPDKYGRESDTHITVLYGLEDCSPTEVAELAAHRRPVRVKLGKVSQFEAKDYDVLKVEVKSAQLHNLHQTIRSKLKNVNKFPDYKPHLTLAYVKKGKGAPWIGDDRFDGKEFTFDRLTYTSKTRQTYNIQFTGTHTNPYTTRLRKSGVDTSAHNSFNSPNMKNRFRKVANPYLGPLLEEQQNKDPNEQAVQDYVEAASTPALGQGVDGGKEQSWLDKIDWQNLPWGRMGAGGFGGAGLGGLIGGQKGALAGALLGALGGYGYDQYQQGNFKIPGFSE